MTETVTARRARLAPGSPVGVTEEMIEAVVHGFYDRARRDPELGPIFARVVADDAWPAHLARLCDFWSSVMLMTGRYHGTPMVAHNRIAELAPAHFARWLQLFGETAREVCPAPAAEVFVERAGMIAQSLQLGLAVSRGELPPLSAA